jgi:hypothetical protein
MPQLKNNFLASKMNRDKDARLVPPGEYREGRNINVGKSEGADVGALENVRGNQTPGAVASFIESIQTSLPARNTLDIIGFYTDEDTSSLYVFLTTIRDNSSDRLSLRFKGFNFLIQITLTNGVYVPRLLLKGRFLNFDKGHPIIGFNIIENQLFWSDNRNQPRKININLANSTGDFVNQPNQQTDYYYCEDQISVAKFNPYEPIKFIKNIGSPAAANWQPTWKTENEEFLPISLTAPLTEVDNPGTGNDYLKFGGVQTVDPAPIFSGNIPDFVIKSSGNTWPVWQIRNFNVPNGGTYYVNEVSGNNVYLAESEATITSPIADLTTLLASWNPGDLITFQLKNPEYQTNFQGEREYLKDKFVRFSYRFKYDDNEYSLMAPFTQPLFVPGNYGSFTVGDEGRAAINSNIDWFENIISGAELNIQLPNPAYSFAPASTPNFRDRYKVKEIEILVKSSSDNNVYSIDAVSLDTLKLDPTSSSSMLVANGYTTWPYNQQFIYKYNGSKPFQVLPERDITRVSDATPVRSLTQEVAGNRVMYGNYQNAHGAPLSLDYECFVTPKTSDYDDTVNPPIPSTDNTVIKEYYNSTLKQGRTYQVGIVLSDRYGRSSNVILANNEFTGSIDKEKSTVFAPYDFVGTSAGVDSFFGNSLKVSFESLIPETLPSVNFYPGLYNVNTNPLGWYSYKVVVKQSEQEYYNVYLPGALSGNVVYTGAPSPPSTTPMLSYSDDYEVTNISLFGDNINKVPKDTSNISPTDKMFPSNVSLYYRVYQLQYDVNNIWNNVAFKDTRAFPVVNIQQFTDFGPWASKKGVTDGGYPNDGTVYIDPIFNADKNPFIATVDISSFTATSSAAGRVGFANINQTGSNPPATATPPRFSKFLHIAETNPVLSNLDIYWETTTSGLISDLNAAIKNGESSTAPQSTTPWLFEMQEQYPYDGFGLYPGTAASPGPGAFLLQQDISVVMNNGLRSSDVNALVELVSITTTETSLIQGGGSDITASFTLVQTADAADPGVTYNAWNIQFGSQFFSQNNIFGPLDIGETPLQGELVFQIKLSIPGENPAERQITFANNNMTNNKPFWKYTQANTIGEWGTDKENPADVANVLTNWNAERIENNLTVTNEKILLSPFIPLPDSLFASMVDDDQAEAWSVGNGLSYGGKEYAWTMSIRGKQKVVNGDGDHYLTAGGIGFMFFRKNGQDNITSRRDYDNSAWNFNKWKQIAGNNPDSISSNGYFDYTNGCWDGENENAEPYITKVELAIFNDSSSFNGWSMSGIGDQGASPSNTGGWKDFILVDSTQSDGTIGQIQRNDNLQTFGYPTWPFIIEKVNSSNQVADTVDLGSGFCFMADVNRPPFCQIDCWKNGDFRSDGEMTNSDMCVYRVTVGLRETFSGGLIAGSQQRIYIKLIR